MSNKVAVFIYEPITGDLSRAYRGLKTALEFVKAGDEVAVVFDGSAFKKFYINLILQTTNKFKFPFRFFSTMESTL